MEIRSCIPSISTVRSFAASIIPSPSNLPQRIKHIFATQTHPSSSPQSSSREILREIGRKTFDYNNPLPTNEPTTDWKAETNHELQITIQKSSILTIIDYMDPTLDEQTALSIVKEVVNHTDTSIYSAYIKTIGKPLAFFTRARIYCYYFFYSQCGLISDTLHTLMTHFLDKLRSELILKNGGKNLSAFNDRFLIEMSSFLDYYLEAVKDYATTNNVEGSLEVHISKRLAAKQKIPHETICREFAQTYISSLPRIPFFQTLKNSQWALVRMLGKFLDSTIGRPLNRIIRKKLETTVPSLILSSLTKTCNQPTELNKLPFYISITNGIIEQLKKFQQQQAIDEKTPSPIIHYSESDRLPEVVKKLLEILRLEPYRTQKELRENLNKDTSNDLLSREIDKKTNQNLEERIIDGCRIFLSYISDQRNSEQILCRMLQLSNASLFDSTLPTNPEGWAQLKTQYEACKLEMSYEAKATFQQVIQKSIEERFQASQSADTKQQIAEFQEAQHVKLIEFAQKLEIIQKKIDLDPAYIENGLDQLIAEIESYRNWFILQNIEQFPPSFQQGLEKTMCPVYQKINQILDQINQSKSALREIVLKKNEIDHLALLEKQLKPLATNGVLKESPTDALLKSYFLTIQREYSIIRILKELGKKNGLLSCFIGTAKITPISRYPFSNKTIKTIETNNQFVLLPTEDQNIILNSIKKVATSKTPKEIETFTTDLKEKFLQIYKNHSFLQTEMVGKAHQLLCEFQQKANQSLDLSNHDLHESLLGICMQIQDISKESKNFHVDETTGFSDRTLQKFGGTTQIVCEIAGAAIGAAMGSAVGGAGSAAVHYFLNPMTIQTILGVTAGSGLGSTIIGAIGGRFAYNKFKNYVSDQSHSHVMDAFNNFYTFLLKDEVRKWATFYALQCTTKAYKQESVCH